MRTLYQLAEAQAGYFTTSQAAQVGVSRRVLSHRAQQGDLEQVRYGLYRLHDFPQAITRGVLSRRQLRALVRKSPEIAPLVIDALADE